MKYLPMEEMHYIQVRHQQYIKSLETENHVSKGSMGMKDYVMKCEYDTFKDKGD